MTVLTGSCGASPSTGPEKHGGPAVEVCPGLTGRRSTSPSQDGDNWRADVLPRPTGCPQKRQFRCQTASDAGHLASKRAALVQQVGPSAALGRARTPAKSGIRWSQAKSILCTILQYKCRSVLSSPLRRHEVNLLRLGSYMIHTTRPAGRRSRETAWIWAGSPRNRELVSDHIGSHNRAAGGDLVGKSSGSLACVSSASCRQAIA
jgi:hypothetical protein